MRLPLLGLASLLALSSAAPSPSDQIVFVRQDPRARGLNAGVDLWLAGPNGSARRIVGGEGWEEAPAWSPDGDRIAYMRSLFSEAEPYGPVASTDVWTVGAGGRGRRNLTRDGSTAWPTWSPDSRRLAFVRGDGVVLVGRAGSGQVRIARRDDPGPPAWSPDGRRVAFAVPGEVRVVGASGGRQRLLARGAESGSPVAWAPDGRTIAFTGARRGVAGVFLVDARGGRPTLLVRDHLEPAWSPDGRMIVVVRPGTRRQAGLFLVAGRGGTPRRLTRGLDTQPAWSPDSRRIAFRRELLTGDIYVVDAAGDGLRNLSRTPLLDEREPAWRPP